MGQPNLSLHSRTAFCLFVISFIIFPFIGFAQQVTWGHKIGAAGVDNAQRAHLDAQGNVYICGEFSGSNVDFDPSPASALHSSNGLIDAFVAKYTSSGQYLLSITLGGSNLDKTQAVSTDAAGNIYLCGYFRGPNVDFDPGPGTAFLSSNGDGGFDPGYGGDIFVAKYSPTGQYIWAFNVGGTLRADDALILKCDAAGNVFVGGYFREAIDFDPSPATAILDANLGTGFLAKYNTNGQYQWAMNFGQGGNTDNSVFDIEVDAGSNVYMVGYFQGVNMDFDPSPATAFLSSAGGFEGFLAKYTTTGQYVFASKFGSFGTDVVRGIDLDNAGNIYITGDFVGANVDFDPGAGSALLSSNGASDIFVAKYANNGQYIWALNAGSAGGEIAWDVATDGNSLYITGGFTGVADFNPTAVTDNLTSNGGYDIFLAKYTVNGVYECAFNVGSSQDDNGVDVQIGGNNIFYLAGGFQGANVDFTPTPSTYLLSSSGNFDAFFIKYFWPPNTLPTGTINGNTICPGQNAQFTFNALTGTSPFTVQYSDGTNSYTQTNVQSGVPFNLQVNPTLTTTYSITLIQDAIRCSPQNISPGLSATVTVTTCTPDPACTYWPVFGSGYSASIPFSNTVSFNFSNPSHLTPNTAYSTMTPGNWFTPNPTVATTSPPNSTAHDPADIGAIAILPTTIGEFGTVTFASPTTTGFYLHVYQTVSKLDFDHSFTLISSDGDLHVGSSGTLTNNVLIPDVGPGQSPDDANATIYFPPGISQIKFTITDAPPTNVSFDGIKLAFTFPDECINDTTIINDYTPVMSLDPCKNIINVGDAAAFNVGDTVLMIQMKGAVIDSTNTAAFGNITNYKNAGNYEFNYIKAKNGNSIELLNKIERQYDLPDGKVQLITVPYFQDYTVTSTLSCLPWNGSIGGVLVFNVQNDLSLNTNIDVTGRGFKGGQVINTAFNGANCFENNYFYPNGTLLAAPKGESIATISTNISSGKGNSASGGGGGNDHNSGGGGGGNATNGGLGGYQLYECNNTFFDNRGIGGKGLTYNNASNRIYLGGGGGAGHCNNGFGAPGENTNYNGGNGGGIVLISANTITGNNFTILSRGDSAFERNSSGGETHDGMGGGGAGGTILISANSYSTNLNLNVGGGKGGDMHASMAGGHIGPGGGGAGGVVWLNQASLPSGVIVTNNGGRGGYLLQDNNNPYGTTPGSNGVNVFGLIVPIDAVLFKPNIDSVRIKDSILNCNSFDFKGLAYTNTDPITTWQWSFGDGGTATTQNATHSYANAGTYTVKLIITDLNGCKDSITRDVTASTLNFDFSYSQNVCNPLSVQFFPAGVFLSNPYWSFGDGNVSSGPAPVHVYNATGNYLVKYALTNGVCTDTIAKTISINIIQDDIILTPDTTICLGATKKLRTVSSLNFCWTPSTYLDDATLREPTTSTPQAITYYHTAEVIGNNLIVNGDFSAGNSGFTSEYDFSTPNVTEGQYYVGTNPQAWNGSLSACGDHTSGTGNMMLINGSPVAAVNVWKQTVTVTPNTNYAFSTWIQALYPVNPASLQFSINGRHIVNTINASLPTCTWTKFYTTWNSGNNTTAVISIVNVNTQVQGNDFALDDISFAPVFIKRDSVRISIDVPFVRANNDTTVCEGSTVQLNSIGAQTYSWNPASSLSNSNIANPVATITSATQYIVSGTSASGCIAKDTVLIGMYSKPAIVTANDTSICRNTSVQLFASGGNSYSWSPSSTLNNSSIANPVATPIANTTYYVTVTDANTCTNNDSVSVSFRPPPQFSASTGLAVCQDDSVQLNATGGDSYLWSPTSTLSDPTISNPIASPTGSTNYSVTITESFCNESTTLSVPVTVRPLPPVAASRSNDLDCVYDFANLTATGARSYSWSPAGTLNNPSVYNPIARPTATTKYIVKGTDNNGCSNYDSVIVKVDFSNKGIYLMANAFTPNNDGLNDCFGVRYWGTITELEFNIYNRWGQLVFHTTDPGKCWDGTFKGLKQDPGVFVFWVRAKTTCDNSVFRKGTVVLIR